MSLSTMNEVVSAVGINVKNLSVFDLHAIQGRIIRDDVVSKRVRAIVAGRGGCASHSTYVEVIESMPESDRAALRQRVHV